MLPFALQSLDAQLAVVDMFAGDMDDDCEDCPRLPAYARDDIPKGVADALVAHRDLIDALSRGVSMGAWTHEAMPCSVAVLQSVPGLRKLPAGRAARLIVDQYSESGELFIDTEGLKRRVKMALFRKMLVGAIKKKSVA